MIQINPSIFESQSISSYIIQHDYAADVDDSYSCCMIQILIVSYSVSITDLILMIVQISMGLLLHYSYSRILL